MIFCAGLGTRFKPWTDRHPKALAEINGKSLLQRNVEYLQQYGITDVIINVHHFADQIIEAVQKNKGWGSNIIISDETDKVLETGGGLLRAQNLFPKDEFFISLNADILTDFDLNQLIQFHKTKKPLISFIVSHRKTSRNLLFDETGQLYGWRNNATDETRLAIDKPGLKPMAYDCVVMYSYELFEANKLEGKFSLIDMYLSLANAYPIYGLAHQSKKWIDVGKPESVATAETLFKD